MKKSNFFVCKFANKLFYIQILCKLFFNIFSICRNNPCFWGVKQRFAVWICHISAFFAFVKGWVERY